MDREPAGGDELLGATAVASRLGVRPTTVYRWCRVGRLPCLKPGKSWLVRRSALEEFLRRGEHRQTLADHLQGFLTVPDRIIGLAEDEVLLQRLDAAFFRVGEAHGGLLVKFHGGEGTPVERLRADLRRNGLDVDRLEAEGRFRWSAEVAPAREGDGALRPFLDQSIRTGRSLWASFDWTRRVGLETVLRQQEALAALTDGAHLVVKSAALEEAAEDWSPAIMGSAQHAGRGLVRIGRRGMHLSRAVPLPEW